MKPHKHAEVIKAWADGHAIQYRNEITNPYWTDMPTCSPNWHESVEYRVKPQPKPDYIVHQYVAYDPMDCRAGHILGNVPNVRYIFDGETKTLKEVHILR